MSRVVTSLGWRPHTSGRADRLTHQPGHLHPVRDLGSHPALGGLLVGKTILAINTDPDAPMMTKATYAVVGDMHEVIPAILDELANSPRSSHIAANGGK